jgi:hypothetical protein
MVWRLRIFLNVSVFPECFSYAWRFDDHLKIPDLQNCFRVAWSLQNYPTHLLLTRAAMLKILFLFMVDNLRLFDTFILLRKKQNTPFHIYWLSVHYKFRSVTDKIFYFLQVHGHTGGYIFSRITRTLLIHSRRIVFHCVHNDNGV